ncbi:hypothetical protein M5E88_09920 [Akkermansia muciniphila]|nr:hypothetical protein M5E88_09920 [Akkermansia muciniphila]
MAVDRMLFDLKRSGSVREKGTGFKYYRVRPLFRMEEILCGRGGEECARLQWMDMRRQERWRIWLWNGEFHGKKPSPGLVTWPFPGNGKWSCARQPFICIRKDLTRKRLRRNLRSIFPDPG